MKGEELKKIILDDLRKLNSMSIEEYIFYQKKILIDEINSKNKFDKNKLTEVKNNIWMPETFDSYLKIKPKIIMATDKETSATWTYLRQFCSTLSWRQSPGRLLRFYVIDEVTGGYLGVISLGSDFIGIGGRDDKIKWTRDDRLNKKMLRHTAMASTIVPTQPLGYNYVGGKLISLLVLSDVIAKNWENKYNDKLAGFTTTSLFGGYSQYTRLKYWKKCKSTSGKIIIEPSENVYKQMLNWLKENRTKEDLDKLLFKINKKGIKRPVTHPKMLIIKTVFKELGIKTIEATFPKGVYWAPLYKNSNEFLRREATDLIGPIDNSVESLTELWREKYAKKRIANLIKNNRANNNTLFYDDLIDNNWESVKAKYINKIGKYSQKQRNE